MAHTKLILRDALENEISS
jgi:hypothetical protein